MRGINETIITRVITDKGIKKISDLSYGDILFEYETGRKLTFRNLVLSPNSQKLYEIKYSDGRSTIIGEDDLIRLPKGILIDIFNISRCDLPTTYDLHTFEGYIENRKEMKIDPYSAGIFLIYGDFTRQEVNLPKDLFLHIDEGFMFRLGLKVDTYYKDHVFFNKGEGSNIVMWDELFGSWIDNNINSFLLTNNILDPIIPNEYMYGPSLVRKKMIRGIFDIGFNKESIFGNVNIAHHSEFYLEIVKRLLFSLGISSKIIYSPNSKRQYELHITGPYSTYPGFFYQIYRIKEFIEVQSMRERGPLINELREPFRIISVTPLRNEANIDISNGFIENIKFIEGNHIPYVLENYLPRVSV